MSVPVNDLARHSCFVCHPSRFLISAGELVRLPRTGRRALSSRRQRACAVSAKGRGISNRSKGSGIDITASKISRVHWQDAIPRVQALKSLVEYIASGGTTTLNDLYFLPNLFLTFCVQCTVNIFNFFTCCLNAYTSRESAAMVAHCSQVRLLDLYCL